MRNLLIIIGVVLIIFLSSHLVATNFFNYNVVEKIEESFFDSEYNNKDEDFALNDNEEDVYVTDDYEVEEEDIFSILEKAKEIENITYTVFVETSEEDFQIKYYQKGNKMRAEMEEDGEKIINLINIDDGDSYSYIPSLGMAITLDSGDAKDIIINSLKRQSERLLEYDLEVTGEDIVNGKETIIVEYVDVEEMQTTVWIWKDYGIPVMSEAFSEDVGFVIGEVRDVDFSNIDDSYFNIPEDVEILDTR